MANYVVDASVLIEYNVTGPSTPRVQKFFDQITDTDRLIIPEFCLLECTNVIWKQVRFNDMLETSACDLLNVIHSMKLQRVPMQNLLTQSLRVALNNTLPYMILHILCSLLIIIILLPVLIRDKFVQRKRKVLPLCLCHLLPEIYIELEAARITIPIPSPEAP